MTLHQLRHFESLAHTQHYQRSAELLGVSQPALSRSISALELELGAPLFEKQGRNVVLSRFGRVFAEHIFAAMEEINTGFAHVKDLTDPRKCVLDISLNYIAANLYLPQVLRGYVQQGQEMAFQLRQGNTPEVLSNVLEGRSEIGLCSYMEDQPEIQFHPLVRYPLRLVVPPDHPLARREQVPLTEIGQYPLILSVDETYYIENMLRRLDVRPAVTCRMGEDRSIANFVACGFGLSILPYDPQLEVCGVCLVPIQDSCAYRDFYLALARGRPLSAHSRDFCRYMLNGRKQGVPRRPSIFKEESP